MSRTRKPTKSGLSAAAIKDPAIRQVLEAMIEHLHVYEGHRGDPLDRVVTFRDLNLKNEGGPGTAAPVIPGAGDMLAIAGGDFAVDLFAAGEMESTNPGRTDGQLRIKAIKAVTPVDARLAIGDRLFPAFDKLQGQIDAIAQYDAVTVETAGEALSAQRVVYLKDSDSRAYYADPSDPSVGEVLGVTLHAAAVGAPVKVLMIGRIDEPTFSFVPGAVFLGPNGTLAQPPPGSGTVLQLGVAVTPQALLVRISIPIY